MTSQGRDILNLPTLKFFFQAVDETPKSPTHQARALRTNFTPTSAQTQPQTRGLTMNVSDASEFGFIMVKTSLNPFVDTSFY